MPKPFRFDADISAARAADPVEVVLGLVKAGDYAGARKIEIREKDRPFIVAAAVWANTKQNTPTAVLLALLAQAITRARDWYAELEVAEQVRLEVVLEPSEIAALQYQST